MGGQTSYLDFLFCTSIRILHTVVDNSSIKSLQSVHVFLLSFLIFFSLHMLKTWYPVLNYFLSLVCNFLRVKSCPTLCDPINCSLPGRLLFPRNFFFRQEYWSGLPFPPSGDLPNPGIKLVSCVGRQILHPLSYLESLIGNLALWVSISEESPVGGTQG